MSAAVATPAARPLLREPFFAGLVLLLWVLLGVFVLYPLGCLFVRAFGGEGGWSLQPLLDVVGNPNHRRAFGNSLLLAMAVGISGTALGFAFAFTAVRAGLPRRWRGFIDTATLLPLISPPFTISVAILFSFGARGLITYELLGIKGFAIYGFLSTAAAETITYFPIAYLTLRPIPGQHRFQRGERRFQHGRLALARLSHGDAAAGAARRRQCLPAAVRLFRWPISRRR